jgi:thioredoxin 1
MSAVMEVTDETFEKEVEEAEGVAMVDFWAAWCGPCRLVGPIVDELAQEYAGQVKVAKLDVDASQRTAMKFGIRSIPSILIFKDGQLVDSVVGAVPKQHLEQRLKQHLD